MLYMRVFFNVLLVYVLQKECSLLNCRSYKNYQEEKKKQLYHQKQHLLELGIFCLLIFASKCLRFNPKQTTRKVYSRELHISAFASRAGTERDWGCPSSWSLPNKDIQCPWWSGTGNGGIAGSVLWGRPAHHSLQASSRSSPPCRRWGYRYDSAQGPWHSKSSLPPPVTWGLWLDDCSSSFSAQITYGSNVNDSIAFL